MEGKNNDLINLLSTVQSLICMAIKEAQETKRTEDLAACETAVRQFVEEVIIKCPGKSMTAREIRRRFVLWHVEKYPNLAVPSQKKAGALLRSHGLRKEKRGGLVKYLDLSITD
jgi:hypothetical protein